MERTGLSLGACLSNLKSAPLTILEQLAFNALKILGVTVPSKMLGPILVHNVFNASCQGR